MHRENNPKHSCKVGTRNVEEKSFGGDLKAVFKYHKQDLKAVFIYCTQQLTIQLFLPFG